ncbi:MAG: lipid A biosynthesis acyltransferase [Chitinophagaceae bacterium]
MPTWQGKSQATPLGYRIFVGILKRFGVLPAYVLLRFVAVYYFFFSRKSSRAILAYFRQRLGYGAIPSLLKLYRNYYLFGQTLIDKIVMMSGIRNRFTFDFDGEEHLHAMAQLQKGGLLLSAHIGNWEIAGHLLKRLETRINIVMFDGEHQRIKDYLEKVTGKRNARIIVIKDDLSHIYAISDALKNNELVCMHADRFLEGNKTVTVNFLGADALLPAGPFLLAATFKAPVSFVFSMKETSLHYHFFASEPKAYPGKPREEAIQQMANDFALEMEKKVRAYPEQWFNYYDFWKQ